MKKLLFAFMEATSKSQNIATVLFGGIIPIFITFKEIGAQQSILLGCSIFFIAIIILTISTLVQTSRSFIRSKYRNDLIAYFPLEKDMANILSNENSIPIFNLLGKNILTVDKFGLLFGKYYGLAHLQELPYGNQDRTFFCWFRFSSNFDLKNPTAHFLYSYGQTKTGKAFGLMFGSPQTANRRRETQGLTAFLYSEQSTKTPWDEGDSEALISKNYFKPGVWYFSALSFSSSDEKICLRLGTEKDSITFNKHIKINTHPSDYLFIGQIPSERPSTKEYDAEYVSLPLGKWNFDGNIRELMIFNETLDDKKMNDLVKKTKLFL